MADRPTLSIRPAGIAAKAVITRDGDSFRVSVLDGAGEALEALCRSMPDHKAAYGYAGGLRLVNRCTIIDLAAPEVD